MQRAPREEEMLEREAAVAKKKKEEDKERRDLRRRAPNELNRELDRRLAPGGEGSNRDVEQLKEHTSSFLKTLGAKATENTAVLRLAASTRMLANNRLAPMRDIGY
jgi:hypothetical protein